jgi:hypothetical protein
VNNNYDEELENEQEFDPAEDYVYKNVIRGKQNSRLFSILSLVLAVLSVGLCFIPALGIILGLAAMFIGIFSRRNIGYFDGLTLGGIITSIFGTVFSVAVIVLISIL